MPRCVYMVDPPSAAPLPRPCTCPLLVHCPFRESQFSGQHPTLVFICRYFFLVFFLSAWLRNENFIFVTVLCVCVSVCVLVIFRYVPCAVFSHYSYDPCTAAQTTCQLLVFGLALATFAYCLHLQHITKVDSACTFTLHIYICMYRIYTIHIIYSSIYALSLACVSPICLACFLFALSVWQISCKHFVEKMINYNRISITISIIKESFEVPLYLSIAAARNESLIICSTHCK